MILYKYKEVPVKDFGGRTPKIIREIIIVKYDTENEDVWIPSPLTHFIYHRHTANNHSNNTKIQSAIAICGFLNYLIRQVDLGEDECFECLKEGGLGALNIFHLARYLNYLSSKSKKEQSFNTIKRKELILIYFYSYLYDRNITSGKDAEIRKAEGANGNLVPVNPFSNRGDITIKYPLYNGKKKVLKDMDVDIWSRFLQYAYEHYPNIALGVAMQTMGGLRRGEVVNLKIDSISQVRERNYITVDIEDNQDELFDRGIHTKRMQTKRPRFNQPVFNFDGMLFTILDKHLETIVNRVDRTNEKALFIDAKGQPMSGDSYSKYFSSLKKDFIQFLLDNGFATVAAKLQNEVWSTHIGRHIFTNHLLRIGAVSNSEGDPIAKYLMALRGDKNEKSSNEYIDTKVIIDIVTEKIMHMSHHAISDSSIGY